MSELKEGQQIIFKHPANGKMRAGSYSTGWVSYCVSGFPTAVPFSEIIEWCDASEAWKAHEFVNSKPFINPVYGPTVKP